MYNILRGHSKAFSMLITYLCSLELLLAHPALNYTQLYVKKLRRSMCCPIESAVHSLLAHQRTDPLTCAVSSPHPKWQPTSSTGAKTHVGLNHLKWYVCICFLPEESSREWGQISLGNLLKIISDSFSFWIPCYHYRESCSGNDFQLPLLKMTQSVLRAVGDYCLLLVGGWVHGYLKATKAKSSQICKFGSFEGTYENFPTFPFVSLASLFFFSFPYFPF